MPEDEFVQSSHVTNHVFLVVQLFHDTKNLQVEKVLGTGFFIGRNFALTAKHVVRSGVGDRLGVAMADHLGNWSAFPIRRHELHPEHDVALLEVAPPNDREDWRTCFTLAADHSIPSTPYHLWGYPADVMCKLAEKGSAKLRPDFVYVQGYVRRRMTGIPLEAIFGTKFFELSDRAVRGFSGGPVVLSHPRRHWDVFALYVGERSSSDGIAVGYAVRFDALAGWDPEILGRPLFEDGADPVESHPTAE